MLKELTKNMSDQIPSYRDNQIQVSKNTSEADWDQAEASILSILNLSGVNLHKDHVVLRASSPIEASLRGNKISKSKNYLFQSSSYGGTCARNNFFVEVCGVEISKDFNNRRLALDSFVKSCGGAYLSNKVTIIYDRPSILNISTTSGVGVLHCEDGPAIAWGRDSTGKYSSSDPNHFALYFWEGTKVPDHWIAEKPKTSAEMAARAAEVLSCNNQEQLRAGCEILGWVPVLESLGMKVLDEDPNPQFGQLVSVDLPDSPGAKFIVATCGTGRKIAVPADPNASTAIEAGAKSYGLPVDIYRRLKVRT